jgi:hypothetical protein
MGGGFGGINVRNRYAIGDDNNVNSKGLLSVDV